MRNTKKNVQTTIVVIGLLLITSSGFAQLPGFNDPNDKSSPAPISSIVALGMIAGAAYGIKKMRN